MEIFKMKIRMCENCGIQISRNPNAKFCKTCSNKIIPRGVSLMRRGTFSLEHAKKISASLTGKVISDETRKKMSIAHIKIVKRGSESNFWRGGTTSERQKITKTIEYKNWRMEVMKRDNFTCQICGVIGGRLQIDHIKPWAFYPKLRMTMSNVRTLCIDCHKKTPTYLRNKKI